MNKSSRDLLQRLENVIKRQDDKTVGFDDFMREALYHPQTGYFAQGYSDAGHYALFSTDPATVDVYAQILGLQIEQMWYWLDQPRPFTIVEEFPNDAGLLTSLLRWMRTYREELFQAVNVVLVDPFPNNRARQEATLEETELKGKCQWVETTAELSGQHLQGVFLSAEQVGSLCAKIARHNGSHWEEMRVAWDDRTAQPVFKTVPLEQDAPLQQALDLWQVPSVRNFQAELCLEHKPWLEKVEAIFDGGFMIIVDWGYDAATLYHPNRINGSLSCRHGERKSGNPLAEPGAWDLSCSVNFSSLEKLGKEAGFLNLGTIRHSDAMRALAHESYTIFRDEQGRDANEKSRKVLQAFRNLLFPPIQSGSYRMLILATGFDPQEPPHLAVYGMPEEEPSAS